MCPTALAPNAVSAIVPLEGARDEARARAHLVQQRHHLVMRVKTGARGERHGRGRRDGNQKQNSVCRV